MVNEILHGDSLEVLKTLPDKSINCCVTSPPYWGMRDYGVDGQLGLEPSPEEYVDKLVAIFCEVKRVLRDDGTLWLNLGDTYVHNSRGECGSTDTKQLSNKGSVFSTDVKWSFSLKQKNLIGIPWRVALALQADDWYLRSDIIWHKPNPMPESVRDRPTKSHEYIFLLSKSPKYYYDQNAIREPYTDKINRWGGNYIRNVKNDSDWDKNTGQPLHRKRNMRPNPKGKNKRTVWKVATKPFKGAHFAAFPPDLIRPCVLAGCPENGIVLDPFFGAGTTGMVAIAHNRNYLGIELNKEYIEIAKTRIKAFNKEQEQEKEEEAEMPLFEYVGEE